MTEYANFDDDHVQAPADHAPRKETLLLPDMGEIIVTEVDDEDAWIQGPSVEVNE